MENLHLTNLDEKLKYRDGHDTYSVPAPESWRKGALIQNLNTIETTLGKDPIDLKRFEELMNYSLGRLTEMVIDQSSLLERVRTDHSY